VAAHESDERVLGLFRDVRQAMLTNDAEVLRTHVAPDYEGSDAGGRLHDKQQMIAAYGPGGVKLEAFDVSEVRTKSWSGTVLVQGVAFIRGRYGDDEFQHDLRFLDVYTLREADWLLVASHVTDIRETGPDGS
jgi:hypothetical protein